MICARHNEKQAGNRVGGSHPSPRAVRLPPVQKGGSRWDGLWRRTLPRRQFLAGLVGSLGSLLLPLLNVRPACAVPEKLASFIREATGGTRPKTGRVRLTLPPLAESGNSVPLTVQVESPMTPEAYVKSIHILSEKNPRPVIARFFLGPRAGRAEVSTRIRLAGTQQIAAVAVMNDGSAWLATTDVVVTAAACIEGY